MPADGLGCDTGTAKLGGSSAGTAWSMRAAILAILAVIFQSLTFPPFGWSWLAWLAPLPVFLIFPAPTLWAAVLAGWLIGTSWALAVISPWLWPALQSLLGNEVIRAAVLLQVVCQMVFGNIGVFLEDAVDNI